MTKVFLQKSPKFIVRWLLLALIVFTSLFIIYKSLYYLKAPQNHVLDTLIILEPRVMFNSTNKYKFQSIEMQNIAIAEKRDRICEHSLLNHSNDSLKQLCICDYLNLKGLEKSGTTWMINALHAMISDYMCKKIIAQTTKEIYDKIFICKRFYVGSWARHKLIAFSMPYHWEKWSKPQIAHEIKSHRFCNFIIFRDLRDRKLSWTHWQLHSQWMKKIKEKKELNVNGIVDGRKQIQEKKRFNGIIIINDSAYVTNERMRRKVNSMTVLNFKHWIEKYNKWWNFYRNLQLQSPMEYYIFFYEDMMLNIHQQIERILHFIGFYHLANTMNFTITDDDIRQMIALTNHSKLESAGKNTNFRKGKICAFDEELISENVLKINKMTSKYLLPVLIEKLNQTCAIP